MGRTSLLPNVVFKKVIEIEQEIRNTERMLKYVRRNLLGQVWIDFAHQIPDLNCGNVDEMREKSRNISVRH